jgi:hypothetical protein
MSTPQQGATIEPELARHGLHEHLCSIYDNESEHFAVALPFIRIGLARGEKCVYVADDMRTDDVASALIEGGIDVDEAVATEALTLISKEQAYLKAGFFDPEWMFGYWKDATAQAMHERFTGGGVEVEDLKQIFTTFFTTKPQGTGVGLSISRSIIQSQQGRLWATRNPAAGTTFHCRLPLPNGLRESIGNVATRQHVPCDGNGAG